MERHFSEGKILVHYIHLYRRFPFCYLRTFVVLRISRQTSAQYESTFAIGNRMSTAVDPGNTALMMTRGQRDVGRRGRKALKSCVVFCFF